MKRILISILFLHITTLVVKADHQWRTVVYAEDVWHYFVGTQEPPTQWNTLGFNASDWPTGQGGFGYGDNDDNTVVGSTVTVYIRINFQIYNISDISQAVLHVDYDDGFVAYINGSEVARSAVEGNPPKYDQIATISHEAFMYRYQDPELFKLNVASLQDGDNVLAIQVHNRNIGSSDLTIKAYLTVLNKDGEKYGNPPDWFSLPVPFEASVLPLFIIDTENNENIPDEPKINATMKIIDNGERNYITDEPNIYNGRVGVEIRGNYSATLPQKPYGIETRDENGQNNNVALWDFPKENDWILLANYNDKTFLRNTLIYHLFEKMGHYAPRTKHAEVIVNGSYDGIYVFTEKIKVDKGRVDIANLKAEDNEGDEVTGGYIFKIDYFDGDDGFYSSFHPIDDPNRRAFYVFHDPDKDEITSQQRIYLESFIKSFESVLYSNSFYEAGTGYDNYIDVSSFIDYFILGELSRNSDAFKKSKYYYKDKDSKGGLIQSGPVWDFDWAFKDLELYGLTNGEGWMYRINEWNRTPPSDGWMVRLMQDSTFVDKVNERYYSLRKTILSTSYLFNYVDSIHSLLDEAQEWHYKRWDILGKNVGASELGTPPSTYAGVMIQFKDWVSTRLRWLDRNIVKLYESATVRQTGIDNQPLSSFRLFPNMAPNSIFIENSTGIQQLEVYNSTGRKVISENYYGAYSVQLALDQLTSGLYIVQFTSNDFITHVSKFIKK